MSSHRFFRVARCVVLGAVAALTFGVAAHAGDALTDASTSRAVVSFADLDLSKDADARELYARLQVATVRVCRKDWPLRDLGVRRLYEACYQDTLARAVDSVGDAAVNAMYAADDRIRVTGREVR